MERKKEGKKRFSSDFRLISAYLCIAVRLSVAAFKGQRAENI